MGVRAAVVVASRCTRWPNKERENECGIHERTDIMVHATGIEWLIALVKIPSGYRTGRCWQTGRTREQTELAVVYNWTAVAHWTR